MFERLVVLSFRAAFRMPAMCCVVELENVLERSYAAEIVEFPARITGNLSQAAVIFVGLNFGQIYEARRFLIDARMRGAKVLVYSFDAWNVEEFFYNPRRDMKARIFSDLRLENICDLVFVPFSKARLAFREQHRAIVRHLPLGVDTSLAFGLNYQRPISVLGYGRQPTAIDDALSLHFNSATADGYYYHTQHMKVGEIGNYAAHRRQFWKIAQSSALALAFDQSVTQSRAYYSIVGQRWFECLAAGCVIIGKRPQTEEVDGLLDWQNSTIELPDEPASAINFIENLLSQKALLAEVRSRNVEHVKLKHDWTKRIDVMLAEAAA